MGKLSKHQKITIALAASINLNTKRKRKIWVKEYLLLREKLSNMQILSVLEPCDLINYLRVGVAEFECLLKLVTPYIQKEDTVLRQSVSAKQRLVVTLRFLTCIFQIKDINIKAMSKLNTSKIQFNFFLFQLPENETEWKEIAEESETKWNFSHCVGSCDGKHIAIEKPPGKWRFVLQL
ncbi:hypothetical protein ABMA28_003137 [Loxostege sticticalis]|uniref:Transposase n=1 Tax=Loxostege sticticalis TaxID=481309 RepID=A0ABD0SW95_LOXSC